MHLEDKSDVLAISVENRNFACRILVGYRNFPMIDAMYVSYSYLYCIRIFFSFYVFFMSKSRPTYFYTYNRVIADVQYACVKKTSFHRTIILRTTP
jgi:hypothetical protein